MNIRELNFLKPNNAHEIKKFLNLCKDNKSFMIAWIALSSPLIKLTLEKRTFELNLVQEKAFYMLINQLSYIPILKVNYETLMLTIDVNENTFCAKLVKTGQNKLVKYLSEEFRRKDSVKSETEKITIATVYVLSKCRPYYYGNRIQINAKNPPLNFGNLLVRRGLENLNINWVKKKNSIDHERHNR